MVLAGAGVAHDVLVKLAEERFGGDFGHFRGRKAPKVLRPPAVYKGGEWRVDMPDELMLHVGVFYEGVPFNHPDMYAMATLQTLLGGGSSFSSGGPGKGMYSRLYVNVLNAHGWIDSIQAQMFAYSDSALFGLTGTTAPTHARALLDVFTTELRRLLVPVHPYELARAKNQLKASMFMHLESRAVQFEDMARQVLELDTCLSPAQAGELIDAVTPEDISRVVERMLGTPPTLAVTGDCAYAPSLADYKSPLAAKLK